LAGTRRAFPAASVRAVLAADPAGLSTRSPGATSCEPFAPQACRRGRQRQTALPTPPRPRPPGSGRKAPPPGPSHSGAPPEADAEVVGTLQARDVGDVGGGDGDGADIPSAVAIVRRSLDLIALRLGCRPRSIPGGWRWDLPQRLAGVPAGGAATTI